MDPLSDAKVIDSWHTNAAAWSDIVRDQGVESRRLVTDAAIVDAVTRRAPRRVLDLGCGEGWLSRRLAQEHHMDVLGVDAIPDLVRRAQALGGARYEVASYESLATRHFDPPFDAVVANFSLLGAEAVDGVVARVPAWLSAGGCFIVQTVHPLVANGERPYRTGWREGSWAGFPSAFTDPAPWYFRTTADWISLVVRAGLAPVEVLEPLHPTTERPASLLIVARRA
ncbi:MAG: class I SAM-dependent methyltransferase [Gemmatimonadetes bacterium]|nr:class I SAM-dependent methyltransferase [Gemmatimonadota bacterium]